MSQGNVAAATDPLDAAADNAHQNIDRSFENFTLALFDKLDGHPRYQVIHNAAGGTLARPPMQQIAELMDDDEKVKVSLGDGHWSFVVSKKLLSSASDFFKMMVKPDHNGNENQEIKVALPMDTPQTFVDLLTWKCLHKLPVGGSLRYSNDFAEIRLGVVPLINLYRMADRLSVDDIKGHIGLKMLKIVNSEPTDISLPNPSFSPLMIEFILETTTTEPLMRRALATSIARAINEYGKAVEMYAYAFTMKPTFAMEVMNAIQEANQWNLEEKAMRRMINTELDAILYGY